MNRLLGTWSVTRFPSEALSAYAAKLMLEETRQGIIVLCLVCAVLLAGECALYVSLGLPQSYMYTSLLLGLFVIHVLLSARTISDITTLHLLGTTLLVVSGMALVLLAHQTGTFSQALFAAVALLFVLIPLVPWGVREAGTVTVLIYGMFTASLWSSNTTFEAGTLATLQFIMLGTSLISVAAVARNVSLRRSEINTQFELEEAHKKILILSHKDPLTGAWNRRYLKGEFAARLEDWRREQQPYHFAFVDIDDFKPLNDTFGHDFGDLVLQWVSTALESAVGDDGCVVRMGGDEFALLFVSDDPEALLKQGVACVSENALETSRALQSEVRLSIGMVTVSPEHEVSQKLVYKEADLALYEAKARKISIAEGMNLVHRQFEVSGRGKNVLALGELFPARR